MILISRFGISFRNFLIKNKLARRHGPAFLGIGCQKAGTGWFYDAFKLNDNCKMLPIKEVHHYDMLQASRFFSQHHQERLEKFTKKRVGGLSGAEKKEWFSSLSAYKAQPSLTNYKNLFSVSGTKISGDITPGYSVLNDQFISTVREDLGDIPIFMLSRDPLGRIISAYNMFLRFKMRRAGIPKTNWASTIHSYHSIEKIEEYLSREATKARSFPSQIYAKWSKHFSRVIVYDFNHIIDCPEDVLRHAFGVVGVSVENIVVPRNRKDTDEKVTLSESDKKIFIEYLGEELKEYNSWIHSIRENLKK
jgi:hypothetical protein